MFVIDFEDCKMCLVLLVMDLKDYLLPEFHNI